MSAFTWILLGLWMAGCAGFFVFACVQIARDAAHMSDLPWPGLKRGGQRSTKFGT